MKKVLSIIFALFLCAFPILGFAEEKKEINISDYKTLGLDAALESEEIEKEYSNYSENDNQATIYLSRGQGCGYCKAFLTFLNSITEEYGKYFKLVSFESWYDTDNSELLNTISEFVNNPAQGVPYIIIGENVFPGYASDYDESIKTAITDLYDSSNKYDVFEAYNESLKEAKKADSASMNKVIIWNLVFTTLSTVIIILVIVSTNNKKCACHNEEKQFSRAFEAPMSLEEDDEDFDDENYGKEPKNKTAKKVNQKKTKKPNNKK